MFPKYFDTHCHIQLSDYDKDRFGVIEQMKAEGVAGLVVGTNAADSAEALSTTTLWGEGLWAVVGAHPIDAAGEEVPTAHFRALLQNDKVVGVGESGLDYYRLDIRDTETKRTQRDMFDIFVALAIEHNLPLMLHCRPTKGTMDAYKDVLDILRFHMREKGSKLRGSAHFFVGDVEIAQQFLDLGFKLSFSGVITFARDYDAVVKYAPIDSILSETDAPFVTPVPYRGQRNNPIFVKEVVKKIAEIRGEDFEGVRTQLVENARRLFDIK